MNVTYLYTCHSTLFTRTLALYPSAKIPLYLSTLLYTLFYLSASLIPLAAWPELSTREKYYPYIVHQIKLLVF